MAKRIRSRAYFLNNEPIDQSEQYIYEHTEDPEFKEFIAENYCIDETRKERMMREFKRHKLERSYKERSLVVMEKSNESLVEIKTMKNKILADLVKAVNRVVDEMVFSPESESKSIYKAKTEFNVNKE